MSDVQTLKPPHRLLSSGMPAADYGVFLLATPLIACVALLVTAFAAHSVTGFIWLLVLTALTTALLAVGEIFQAPAAWESGSPLKFVGKWLALVGLLWPIGYPAYLRERRRFLLDNWFVAGTLVTAAFLAAAVGAVVITVTGYGEAPPQSVEQAQQAAGLLKASPRWAPDPGDLYLVKTGHLDNCAGKTLEQEVNGFLDKPVWEAGATADGVDFVNVSGGVTLHGKPASAVFQFVLSKDKVSYKYQGFTIDGVPQTIFVAAYTMAQMCG